MCCVVVLLRCATFMDCCAQPASQLFLSPVSCRSVWSWKSWSCTVNVLSCDFHPCRSCCCVCCRMLRLLRPLRVLHVLMWVLDELSSSRCIILEYGSADSNVVSRWSLGDLTFDPSTVTKRRGSQFKLLLLSLRCSSSPSLS